MAPRWDWREGRGSRSVTRMPRETRSSRAVPRMCCCTRGGAAQERLLLPYRELAPVRVSRRPFPDEGAEGTAVAVQGPDPFGEGAGLVVEVAAADAPRDDQ